LLWFGPEQLRSGDLRGTKEGDIYGFAMVCSELVNYESVWNGISEDQDIEGLFYYLYN